MLAAKHTPADALAIAAGIDLAALLLLGWRVEGGVEYAPAELELVTAPSQDVAVTPAGETSAVARPRPGSTENAPVREMGIRNATGSEVRVEVSITPQSGELDDVLGLRIVTDDRQVFAGSLAELVREGAGFPLAGGAETNLEIHAHLREDAPVEAWAGRSGAVRIELGTRS